MPLTLSTATLALMRDDQKREQLCDWLSSGNTAEVLKVLRRGAVAKERASPDTPLEKHDAPILDPLAAALEGGGGGDSSERSRGRSNFSSSENFGHWGGECLCPIEMLKSELSKRFSSVYEAFTFLDMNGDGGVTVGELRAMLRQLGVSDLDNVSRALECGEDAEIDLNRFVAALAWHPTANDHQAEVDHLRPRRERIVTKAFKLGGAITAVKRQSTDVLQGEHRRSSRALHVSNSPLAGTNGHDARMGAKVSGATGVGSGSKSQWQHKWQKSILAVTSFSSLLHESKSNWDAAGRHAEGQREEHDARHRTEQRSVLPWKRVDWSWRKSRLDNPTTASRVGGQSWGKSSLSANSAEEAQADKRRKLFVLFEEYDADKSGKLDPEEVTQLLKDLGHTYSVNQVRAAIKRILPSGGAASDAVDVEEFAQWWSNLNWFHDVGVRKEALVAASVRYMKERWLEQSGDLVSEIHECVEQQRLETEAFRLAGNRIRLHEDDAFV